MSYSVCRGAHLSGGVAEPYQATGRTLPRIRMGCGRRVSGAAREGQSGPGFCSAIATPGRAANPAAMAMVFPPPAGQWLPRYAPLKMIEKQGARGSVVALPPVPFEKSRLLMEMVRQSRGIFGVVFERYEFRDFGGRGHDSGAARDSVRHSRSPCPGWGLRQVSLSAWGCAATGNENLGCDRSVRRLGDGVPCTLAGIFGADVPR